MDSHPTASSPAGLSTVEHNSDYEGSDQHMLALFIQSQEQHQSSKDPSLWGSLRPFNEKLRPITFSKPCNQYKFGSTDPKNNVIIPGLDDVHFIITRKESERSAMVSIQDVSQHGTFLRGTRMVKTEHRILNDGDTIYVDAPSVGRYSYTYCDATAAKPSEGLYASYDVRNVMLGKGVYGKVMWGIQLRTGLGCAVKFIEGPKEVIQRQQVSYEVKILKSLKHKHICKLLDVFFEGRKIILAMECAAEGNLLDYIDDHPIETTDSHAETVRLMTYQMCSAIKYIHSKGIIHRDLKPENILVFSITPPIVKVADFGISKAIEHSQALLQSKIGTPLYMAPEILANLDGYTSLVDSWSLGATILHLITSKQPFKSEHSANSPQVEWAYLDNCRILDQNAKTFVRSLLVVDPLMRTSLTDSLRSSWLVELTEAEKEEEEEELDVAHELLGTDSSLMLEHGYLSGTGTFVELYETMDTRNTATVTDISLSLRRKAHDLTPTEVVEENDSNSPAILRQPTARDEATINLRPISNERSYEGRKTCDLMFIKVTEESNVKFSVTLARLPTARIVETTELRLVSRENRTGPRRTLCLIRLTRTNVEKRPLCMRGRSTYSSFHKSLHRLKKIKRTAQDARLRPL